MRVDPQKVTGPTIGVDGRAGGRYYAIAESRERPYHTQDPNNNSHSSPRQSSVAKTAGLPRRSPATVGRPEREPCRRPRAAGLSSLSLRERVDGPPGAARVTPGSPKATDRPTKDGTAGAEGGRGAQGLWAPSVTFGSLSLSEGRGKETDDGYGNER